MEKFNIAWENAIKFNNVDGAKSRMCYICDDQIKFNKLDSSEKPKANSWNIDWVDGNINNNNNSNIVATHAECNKNKVNINGFWLYINKKNYEDRISWNDQEKAAYFL
ncbi:hypothetical protein SSABA_v1c07720 [Spiroplasma sabaudiense Ar-1343]|uniref:Uncharacterized protein n=1 Tax=Spiroplasma sabaudiense Ar-1343 TaxID=1276257 RepID=W6AKC1_9MOLU|nr:hypothetical protein [Spiroplasma sabaudiense]AHI54174.1 hypothetical protein SSABA_v1c07720 [Spiroplasma sabaudiense Ar-1343]